jgi:L-asparaginase / beta-aspartyl-peptidase
MNRTIPLPFLACMAGLTLLVATTSQPQKPSVGASQKAAIEALIANQASDWNRGDVAAFAKGYWNSPQLTFAGSTGITRGYDLVVSHYKQTYPDQAAMGHLDFSDLEIHALGENAALVLGKWHLTRQSGDVGGVFSLVLQKFPEGWKIVHDHTSRVPSEKP